MSSEGLFRSRLGDAFAELDPQLQWVHSGASRDLTGTVTVARGASLIAKLLGALTSLPPALQNAPLRVQILTYEDKEIWIRTYAGRHRMRSTLSREGDCLVERLGPASLRFRLMAREAGMDWRLERVSMLGIALPVSWFQITARVDVNHGRYHFLIDSSLRGVGLIVRYEGFADAGS
jgi:hypothetical protein